MLDQRADGFHNIVTIFQEVNFCDKITIEESKTTSFNTNVDWLGPVNNTCIKAVDILKDNYPHVPHFKICLLYTSPSPRD